MTTWRRAAVIAGAVVAAVAGEGTAQSVPVQPVGMVINGGISLGAYQAGVTYALMRFLVERRTVQDNLPGASASRLLDAPIEFQIATGSSAGNINAFLAALTWCDSKAFKPRENLFWDTWINVGFDKLAPYSPWQRDYKQLFRAADGSPDFPRDAERLRDKTDPWRPDRSIYSEQDGLLTRRAFLAGLAHLRERLQERRYRQCLVKVGITVTRADVVRLESGAATQRFVVPLSVASQDCQESGECSIAVGNYLPWLDSLKQHEDIGKFLMLPQSSATSEIPTKGIFDLITASSAFPVAFAPQALDRCVLPGDMGHPLGKMNQADGLLPPPDGMVCPRPLERAVERYIDGGLFDNIPLGLALELASPVTARQPIFLYVDDSKRRSGVNLDARAPSSNGLQALFGILGQFVTQTRQYELQALARYEAADAGLLDGRFFATSRFMPVAGSYLGAFGAFPLESFRKVDYYIGVYDGIRSLAESVGGGKLDTAVFAALQKLVLGTDAELLAFTSNLEEYEQYWTGLAGEVVPRDRCDLAALGEDIRSAFRALCRIDERARILARTGSNGGIARYQADEADFEAFVRESDSVAALGGDLKEWEEAMLDRLIRRALDVEAADARVLADPRWVDAIPQDSLAYLLSDDMLRRTLLFGRLALAAGMERGSRRQLTTSSIDRVSGHRLTAGSVLSHLFPYFVAWDSVRSRAEIGWEAKLRLRRWLLGLDPALSWDPHAPSDRWAFRGVLAVGYDRRNRLVDDFQVGVSIWSKQRDFGDALHHLGDFPPASVGLESSVHLLGSKVRLSLGVPMLVGRNTTAGWDWGRQRSQFSTLLNGFYVTLGFSDVSGSLAWLFRSAGTDLLGRCEHGCDEDHVPSDPVDLVSRTRNAAVKR